MSRANPSNTEGRTSAPRKDTGGCVPNDQACRVPLLELLRKVPTDLRAEYVIQRADDGTPTGHAMVPVGRYMHEAAQRITALHDACNGLLGLLQLIQGRPDCPAEIRDVMTTNHRVVDALAVVDKAAP